LVETGSVGVVACGRGLVSKEAGGLAKEAAEEGSAKVSSGAAKAADECSFAASTAVLSASDQRVGHGGPCHDASGPAIGPAMIEEWYVDVSC
jgi:hypothetical protein